MRFPWDKVQQKLIAMKRFTKSPRTHRKSTASYHEGDGSVPPANAASATREMSSEFSTTESYWRKFSDMFQLVSPVMQAATGFIPVAGAPMKAVIGVLLVILEDIDRNLQNKEDMVSLKSRLDRLYCHLCNEPTAQNPREQSRRDSLIIVLQETSHKLANLKNKGLLGCSSRVTQAISGCSNDINNYLSDYQFLAQMQIQREVHEIFMDRRSPRTLVTGCVTLVDATGYEHPILLDYCTTYQQLAMMLGVLFQPNSPEARIQKRYLEQGQYDLCIDEGRQVTQLTSHEWPGLQPGMKITMRIVIKERAPSRDTQYRCHFCKTLNKLETERPSIDCRRCGRRFQESMIRASGNENQDANREMTKRTDLNIVAKEVLEAEMHLIRNFHLQYESEHFRTHLNNELQLMYGHAAGAHVRWEVSAISFLQSPTWHASVYVDDMNCGTASAVTRGAARDEAALQAYNIMRRRRLTRG